MSGIYRIKLDGFLVHSLFFRCFFTSGQLILLKIHCDMQHLQFCLGRGALNIWLGGISKNIIDPSCFAVVFYWQTTLFSCFTECRLNVVCWWTVVVGYAVCWWTANNCGLCCLLMDCGCGLCCVVMKCGCGLCCILMDCGCGLCCVLMDCE